MTRIFLLAIIVVLLAWELASLRRKTDGIETISEVVWTWSRSSTLIPFLAGLLAGHFFWPGGCDGG